MNIFNTQQIQMKARGGMPSSDALDILGNQLEMDPEIAKLLQEQAGEEAKNQTFESLLNPETDNTELLKANQNLNELQLKNIEKISNPEKSVKGLEQAINPEEVKLLGSKQNELNSILSESKNNLNGNALNNKMQLNSVDGSLVAKNSEQLNALEGSQQNLKNILKFNQTSGNQLLTDEAIIADTGVKENNLDNLMNKKNMIANSKDGIVETKSEKNNLMNLSDFMTKQSPSIQSRAAVKAYNPVSESMFSKKMEQSLPGVTEVKKEIKLQDIMFGEQTNTEANNESDFMQSPQQQVSKVQAGKGLDAKIFDLNSLTVTNDKSSSDVINQIQNYILRSSVANQPEVQMSFKHTDLGQVDLLVQKGMGDQLNVSIGTHTAEGAKFFAKNHGDLLNTLNQSGLNIKDIKLDSSQGSHQNLSQDSSRQDSQFQGRGQQHQSQSGERQEDARRREALWKSFQDKEVA